MPERWSARRAQSATPDDGAGTEIVLAEPNGSASRLVVEVRATLRPRDVDAMSSGLLRSLRRASPYVPILVVAPWLSERTREALRMDDLNYLDLTGNVDLRLTNPAVFIHTTGAARDPAPRSRAGAGLRGGKAGRLIRTLAEIRPPYGVGELATATALTPGYVSRLLDTLDREALVERGPRGAVQDVDVVSLLRAWAQNYDLFKANAATWWIASNGARTALAELDGVSSPVAVTGSFAAVRRAPVAAPSQLVAFAGDVERTAAELRLLPTDEAANVVLLQPFDDVVWRRTETVAGITYAAPAQVVVDCLAGAGRMPSEGAALLDELVLGDGWRLNTLPPWTA
ncbi:helix-turn-helix domain-containing protein [Baekduia sp. Peel2402]|uniref:helix-turn-helix domain-containing protein n=1 Tax=Baekduia sp. Peel2402 TaxID=3458296 RepID=UPI00403E7B7D